MTWASTACGKPTWKCWTLKSSGIDIFDEKWKIYSRNPVLPPQKIGPRAVVRDSLRHGGLAGIHGNVHHSVLSAGVVVEGRYR